MTASLPSGIALVSSAVQVGIPQDAIMALLLFKMFVAYQPTSFNTFVAEYADDKAIISVHENPITASNDLQSHFFFFYRTRV